MSNRHQVVSLSERSCYVLAFLTKIAADDGETPSNEQIGDALAAAGHQAMCSKIGKKRHDVVAYELARLIKAGRLAMTGGQTYRVFEVVDLGIRTRRRTASKRSRVGTEMAIERSSWLSGGWPRPTAESAASYDRAVRRREFGKAKHCTDETPDTFRKVGTPYGNRSLTGSAAAECAA